MMLIASRSATNPTQGKKEKVAPTSETVETKKHGQKKKTEAKKLQREEEEKWPKVSIIFIEDVS